MGKREWDGRGGPQPSPCPQPRHGDNRARHPEAAAPTLHQNPRGWEASPRAARTWSTLQALRALSTEALQTALCLQVVHALHCTPCATHTARALRSPCPTHCMCCRAGIAWWTPHTGLCTHTAHSACSGRAMGVGVGSCSFKGWSVGVGRGDGSGQLRSALSGIQSCWPYKVPTEVPQGWPISCPSAHPDGIHGMVCCPHTP